jgi:hypothetical protein
MQKKKPKNLVVVEERLNLNFDYLMDLIVVLALVFFFFQTDVCKE